MGRKNPRSFFMGARHRFGVSTWGIFYQRYISLAVLVRCRLGQLPFFYTGGRYARRRYKHHNIKHCPNQHCRYKQLASHKHIKNPPGHHPQGTDCNHTRDKKEPPILSHWMSLTTSQSGRILITYCSQFALAQYQHLSRILRHCEHLPLHRSQPNPVQSSDRE